jgi:hypothetical protein
MEGSRRSLLWTKTSDCVLPVPAIELLSVSVPDNSIT